MGNDPMWTLLKERSKNPASLYASAGRIAKATSHFVSYLCEMHSYTTIDGMIIRFEIFNLTKLLESKSILRRFMIRFICRFSLLGMLFQIPVIFGFYCLEYETYFWRFFQTIAFCISIIIRGIAFDLPDSVNSKKKKSLSYLSKIFMILSNIHFITLRYGNTGFSLWRDIMDRSMIGLKLYPGLVPSLLASLDGTF